LEHVPGVHALVHLHEGHARLGLATDDRPRDRSGAAILREERRVDVEAAQSWRLKDLVREDAPVGNDERHIGALLTPARGKFASLQLCRLHDTEAELDRALLDRRRGELETTPLRAVRLAD